METQRPGQLRLHRGGQAEPHRTSGTGTEIPPAHFRLEGVATASGSPPTTASLDFSQTPQAPPLSFSKTTVYFAQTVRTAFPLMVMDFLGCLLSLAGAQFAVSLVSGSLPVATELPAVWSVSGLVFLLTCSLLGLYPGIALSPVVELKHLILSAVSTGGVLLLFLLTQGYSSLAQIATMGIFLVLGVVLAPVMRITARAVCSQMSWWGQSALIVGSHRSALRLMKVLSARGTSGLRPIGLIDDQMTDDPMARPRPGFLGTLHDVRTLAEKQNIFWVLIAPDAAIPQETSSALQLSLPVPNIVLIPELSDFPILWSNTRDLGGLAGVHHRERLLNEWTFFLKRVFDVAGVVLGGLVLAPVLIPLFLLAWLSIRIYSPGPVFYGQERVGRNGSLFTAWKFRTMVLNAEAALGDYLEKHPEMQSEWDSRQKLRNDPRIIPGIGGFLRMTSLDELPQLWNVLVGDMSLVGPRPFTPDQLELYGDAFSLYRQVSPGMTGMWQISGRNHMTFQERTLLDVYYIRNWSWWLDLFILGRTIRTVLFREGAF